ncbi:hypothetical protein [Kribbella lupini]|uniref:LPXTG-motif cell wall-anchored protein n=1 Tax=Kribbella lupini TaxID=291602 RepID=A0ABN2AJT4_9ACTN
MIAPLLTASLTVAMLAQGPVQAAPDLAASAPTAVSVVPAADSPSPTPSLGATTTPAAQLPGDNDGDAADYSQTGLVFVSAGALVLAVGGSVAFYLIRRGRRRRTPA